MNLRTIRKAIASVAAFAIVFSSIGTSVVQAGSTFTDVPDDAWFAVYAEALVAANVLSGGGNASPASSTTRGEFALWLAKAAGLYSTDAPTSGLSDMAGASAEVKNAVNALVDAGVINGYPDGTYKPNRAVSRVEAAKILNAGLLLTQGSVTAPFSDVVAGEWYEEHVDNVFANSIVDGVGTTGTFGVTAEIDHAAAWKMIVLSVIATLQDTMRLADGSSFFKGVSDTAVVDAFANGETIVRDGGTTSPTGTTPPPATGGGLTVALNPASPGSATIPDGASSVVCSAIDLTAGGDDVRISGITADRWGVSAAADLGNFYLYSSDGTRLTSGRSLSSDTNQARFNALGLTVLAGQTVTLEIRFDVTAGVSGTGEVQCGIGAAEGITSNASSVTGSFPVAGSLLSISTTDAGAITVTKQGTLVNPAIGTQHAKIAEFRLGATTENALLQRLSLTVKGTTPSSGITNLSLEDLTGTVYATAVGISGDNLATFVLNPPLEIKDGNNKTLQVYADLVGDAADTVLVWLKENTDILAVGHRYGFGMQVTRTGYDGGTVTGTLESGVCGATTSDCSRVALEGGDVTITFNGPTASDVPTDTQDVVFMKFTVTAEQPVDFDQFAVIFQAGDSSATTGTDDAGADTDGLIRGAGTEANVKDIKIVRADTGETVWGPLELTVTAAANDAAQTLTFTDNFSFNAGDSVNFEVQADLDNNAPAAEIFDVTIDISGVTIEDINGDTLATTSVVPSADIRGNLMTTQTPSLTVSTSTSPASESYVKGATNVPMLGIVLRAGDAKDVVLTQLVLTGYIDDDGSGSALVPGVDGDEFKDAVTALRLYDTEVLEANKLTTSAKTAAATTGSITFDGLRLTIPKGTSKKLVVTGDLSNNTAVLNDLVKVDIATVSTDVVVEATDGSTVSADGSNTPNSSTSATAGTIVTIISGGTLTVDVPTNTALAQIVVAGSNNVEFGTLRFTATRESFTVNKLQLRNSFVTALGDHDSNMATVYVNYFTDDAQTVAAKKACTRNASGVYRCDGLTLRVPKSELASTPDYADVKITADLETINTGDTNTSAGDDVGADRGAAPFVTLDQKSSVFEATGAASSNKVVQTTLLYSDAAGWVNTNDWNVDLVATAAATAISVDTGSDADPTNATVGTVVCNAGADTTCGATDEIFVITGVINCTGVGTGDAAVAGSSSDTVATGCVNSDEDRWFIVRGMNNGSTTARPAAAMALNDNLIYVANASFMATNAQTLHRTKLTLSVTTTSRNGATGPTEAVMQFSMAAASGGDVTFRQGKQGSEAAADWIVTGYGTSGSDASASTTPNPVDGAAYMELTEGSDSASAGSGDYAYVAEAATGILDDYTRASFWIRSSSAKASGDALFSSNDATDITSSPTASITIPALTADMWTFVDGALAPGASDLYWGIRYTANSATNSSTVDIDDIRFYNESVHVDFGVSAAWQNSATATAYAPSVAYLRQGLGLSARDVAHGYLDLDGGLSGGTVRTGEVLFVPVGSYSQIVLNAGDTDTFSVILNTTINVTNSTSSTLTSTIDLGNSGNAGDVRWSPDANAPNLTIYNTVTYTGVNATDRISVGTQY